MTSTNRLALIRAARSCRREATRAALLGQRHYAAQLRASQRRAIGEAAAEGAAEPLIKAISCVKNACNLADGLPGRDADPEAHDECVKTMHGEVQSARGFLEAHLNPMNPKASPSRRRHGSGTEPSGPSGTDGDDPYQPVTGDSNLLRALDSLQKADIEADHLVDVIDDEAEADRNAANLHFHTKSADDALQSYRDAILNNPEAEKRRSIARAFAKTIAVGLH
jgi:hypothetical protein